MGINRQCTDVRMDGWADPPWSSAQPACHHRWQWEAQSAPQPENVFCPQKSHLSCESHAGVSARGQLPQPSPLLCRCASNSISCAPVLSFTRTGASCKFYSLPWREMPFRVDHSPVYFYGPIFLNWGFILGLRPRFYSLPQAIQCSERRNAHVGGGEGCECV